MKKRKCYYLVAATAFVAAPVAAGSIEQTSFFADPQMQVESGLVAGCGVRLKSVAVTGDPQGNFFALDASFNLYAAGFALLKGGAVTGNSKTAGGPLINKQIEGFWIKAEGKKPTSPLSNKVLPAETKGYLLYGVDIAAVMELFDATLGRKPVMIGMKVKGEPVERIHSGTAQLSEADWTQIYQCIGELAEQMRSGTDRQKAK